MKKGILAVVIVAVIVVGAVVGFKVLKSQPAGVSGPSEVGVSGVSKVEKSVTELITPRGQVAIADVIPNDVVIYLSAKNAASTWNVIKSSNFWKKTSGLKLWESAQIGTNLAALQAQVKQNLGMEISEENILGLFGQDLSIALVGSKEGLANPQLLIMTQTDPKINVKGKIDTLVEKVKPNATLESVDYSGQKITRLRNPQVPGPEVNYSLMGSILTLGVGIDDSGIKKVLDLYSKKSTESLGANSQYKDSVSALKIRGDLRGLVYVNMAKIVDLIKSLPTPEGTPAGFAAGIEKTLGAIKSISAAIGFDRGMLVNLFFLKNNEAPKSDLLGGWDAAPSEAASLTFLPEQTLLVTVSNSIDFEKIWSSWQDNLKSQSPDQNKAINDAITGFETSSGLKVKEDVLSILGDEICFAITDVDMSGLFPFPHIAILAKVKDDQKALNTIKKLADYAIKLSAPSGVSQAAGAPAVAPEATGGAAAPEAAGAGLAQMTNGKEDYNGVEINFIEIKLPYQTLNPSFAIVNHYLVIGVNKDSIKEIIDVTKGTKNAVNKSKAFKESTANFSPKVNQVAFLNMERTLNLVIEITKWANNLQKGRGEAGAQTDKMIQENVIPLLESLRVIKAIAVQAVNREKGIEETLFIQMDDLKEN